MIFESLLSGKEMSHMRTMYSPEELDYQQKRRALLRATQYAVASAVERGNDLPVGAVALEYGVVVGRYIASDKRLGYPYMHAEQMAIFESMLGRQYGVRANGIAVTLEPCEMCQDFLAAKGIEKVIFNLSRAEVAAKGLVKSHDEDIFGRAVRLGLSYQITQVDDERINTLNRILLDQTTRDVQSGDVMIDQTNLREVLVTYIDSIIESS